MNRVWTLASDRCRFHARPRVIILSILMLGLLACSPTSQIQSLSGESMGSTWSLRYEGADPSVQAIRKAVEARLDIVDRQMSTWKPDSDLSGFNAASAGTWLSLPPELFKVVAAASRLAKETNGAYDPTVGPLVELWGFGPTGSRREPPDAASIEVARERTGSQRLRLDPSKRSILQAGDVRLDLSSIAPGFALDFIGDYLESQGIRNYLLEVGGELRGRGWRTDGNPWRVAIEHPLANDSADGRVTAQHVIALRNASLGSSGDYRHFFEDGGRRYAHRIDPRTGYPLDNAVASVTVMASLGIDADPLATALSVLGVEEGLAFADQHGVAALFIVRKGTGFEEHMTDSFATLIAQ